MSCDCNNGRHRPAERDVTPEATERVVERIMPGFGEQMRNFASVHTDRYSFKTNSRNSRLNSHLQLPGRPKSIRETIDEI